MRRHLTAIAALMLGCAKTSPRVDTARDGAAAIDNTVQDVPTEPLCAPTNLVCDGACVECPSDANASARACQQGRCIISECRAGYVANHRQDGCIARAPERDWTFAYSWQQGEVRTGTGGLSQSPCDLQVSDSGLELYVVDGNAPRPNRRGAVYVYRRAEAATRFPPGPAETIEPPGNFGVLSHGIDLGDEDRVLAVSLREAEGRDAVVLYGRRSRTDPFAVIQTLYGPSVTLSFALDVAFAGRDRLFATGAGGALGGTIHQFSRTNSPSNDFAAMPDFRIVSNEAAASFGLALDYRDGVLWSGSLNGTPRAWSVDVDDGSVRIPRAILDDTEGSTWDLAVSDDARQLYLANTGQVQYWERRDERWALRQALPLPPPVDSSFSTAFGVALAPGGQELFIVGSVSVSASDRYSLSTWIWSFVR